MIAMALGIGILVLAAAVVVALLNDRRPAAESEPDWEGSQEP